MVVSSPFLQARFGSPFSSFAATQSVPGASTLFSGLSQPQAQAQSSTVSPIILNQPDVLAQAASGQGGATMTMAFGMMMDGLRQLALMLPSLSGSLAQSAGLPGIVGTTTNNQGGGKKGASSGQSGKPGKPLTTASGAIAPIPAGAKQYQAHGTGYTKENTAMEGGPKDMKGNELHTLQDFLSGKAPYVSVAMDTGVFKYGQQIRIPQLEKKYGRPIVFRVVDTGGAFQGKGTSRIDICTANQQAAGDSTINGPLTLIPVN